MRKSVSALIVSPRVCVPLARASPAPDPLLSFSRQCVRVLCISKASQQPEKLQACVIVCVCVSVYFWYTHMVLLVLVRAGVRLLTAVGLCDPLSLTRALVCQ